MPNAAVKNMETPKWATMRPNNKTDRASNQSFLLRPEVSFAKVSDISIPRFILFSPRRHFKKPYYKFKEHPVKGFWGYIRIS